MGTVFPANSRFDLTADENFELVATLHAAIFVNRHRANFQELFLISRFLPMVVCHPDRSLRKGDIDPFRFESLENATVQFAADRPLL